MIRRIRRRFIRIALTVLALAMVLVTVVVNAANWINVRGELNETLSYLTDVGGEPMRGPAGRGKRSRGLQNRLDESRFFTVLISPEGECVLEDTSRDTGYSGEEMLAIASEALKGGRVQGLHQGYLYRVSELENGLRSATFLNCETRLDAVRRLGVISAAACLAGILLAWLLVVLFSDRAIKPMIENAVQQKQFITDAGHELKTPLTVISANMDVLALETGENEWIRSTQKQVAGLRGLVNELIYLSRLDEEDAKLQRTTVSLTRVLRESVEPFQAMADFSGKALELDAPEEVRLWGDEGALKRLVSVLCDNAVKYAPEGDHIRLTLGSDGKKARLTVQNGLERPMEAETLRHLFDRFYRVDASRSKDSGGYGIGLSVARAIATRHGGTIQARQTPDGQLCFTVELPLNGRS